MASPVLDGQAVEAPVTCESARVLVVLVSARLGSLYDLMPEQSLASLSGGLVPFEFVWGMGACV